MSAGRSSHAEWRGLDRKGDTIVLAGGRAGELQWARVLALPSGLTARQAMVIGTVGFTGMLAVIVLVQIGVTPDRGEILVTALRAA